MGSVGDGWDGMDGVLNDVCGEWRVASGEWRWYSDPFGVKCELELV